MPNEQPKPGHSRPPWRKCAKCSVGFRPLRKATASVCDNCHHDKPPYRVREKKCESCRRLFYASPARRVCESCRLEKSRRSRGWVEPIERVFRFQAVGPLAKERVWSVTVNAGAAEPIAAREGVIETTDAEVALALRTRSDLAELPTLRAG